MRGAIRKWIPVKGKSVLVIGSIRPWIETILLAEGAKSITTLDYAVFKCDHPKIRVLTPRQLADMIAKSKVKQFDALITYSSIEHSGLGR